MTWQKRARLGVAIFGIACAIVVYAAIGERAAGTPPEAPARLDPKAILESEGAQVQQERGAERDFDITSERQLSYEDGSSRLVGVTIRVRGRAGRDYVLTGQEARSGQNQRELELSGAVRLEASDGFTLKAGSAAYDQDTGVMRAPGEVTFSRGRMSGGGVGMTYDEVNNVITIAEHARVETMDEEGAVAFAFSAGTASLNRQEHVLTLEGSAQVRRGEQTFAGERVVARLTPEEDAVTFIELRGNARVSGGDSALDTMSARDIDLDYGDDGETLEHVRLAGSGSVALRGENGAPGRQFLGETLDITLEPGGGVTRVVGNGDVQLGLPAEEGTAARTVKARALEATGEPGVGLTRAQFDGNVEYREQAGRGETPRSATSRALRIALNGNAIENALFSGSVVFQEQALRASGAEARYDPAAGTLRITGSDAGGPPRVADERIAIEAQKGIDVSLSSRRMNAIGNVQTALRAGGEARLPGLLNNDAPANANADVLQYEGDIGRVRYDGNATLWQGQTAVRAKSIAIDQRTGNFTASGDARSTLMLENRVSIGTATEIAFDDKTRVISYRSHRPPPAPTSITRARGAAPAPAIVPPAAPPPPQVQVNGPQGTIQADRIDVVLAADGNRAERLEAYTGVNARVDTRIATGDRLTYFAEDERYVMTGANAVPVKVVDTCRETSGKTLTFFKTADRIIVDGNEEIRTQTRSGGPCAATPPAR